MSGNPITIQSPKLNLTTTLTLLILLILTVTVNWLKNLLFSANKSTTSLQQCHVSEHTVHPGYSAHQAALARVYTNGRWDRRWDSMCTLRQGDGRASSCLPCHVDDGMCNDGTERRTAGADVPAIQPLEYGIGSPNYVWTVYFFQCSDRGGGALETLGTGILRNAKSCQGVICGKFHADLLCRMKGNSAEWK